VWNIAAPDGRRRIRSWRKPTPHSRRIRWSTDLLRAPVLAKHIVRGPPVTYVESAASASHSACIFRSRATVSGLRQYRSPSQSPFEPARWKFPSQLSLSFIPAMACTHKPASGVAFCLMSHFDPKATELLRRREVTRRRCGLSASMVVADRTVRNSAPEMRKATSASSRIWMTDKGSS